MKTAVFKIIAVLCIFFTGCVVRYCAEPLTVCERRDAGIRDTLNVHINVGRSMYAKNGFPIGFQMSVVASMSDSLGVYMPVVGSKPDTGCWDKLMKGSLDIVIKKQADTIDRFYDGCFLGSMPYLDYEMVVRSDDLALLYAVNRWLGYAYASDILEKKRHLFFRSYDLSPYLNSDCKASAISPYDDIVRKQSERLGWNWKLLSAIIYQESRFFMGAVSGRGAIGLMQVMKSTAQSYGVSNLYDPKENIRAGVSYLAYLKDKYESMGVDSTNVVKFTLAAYNAGESRMQDCINFANSLGRNFHNWDDVADVIPLMCEPEYYQDADFLKHGKFIGKETISYVERVLDLHDLYEAVVY